MAVSVIAGFGPRVRAGSLPQSSSVIAFLP
jgi:hypothetical protein